MKLKEPAGSPLPVILHSLFILVAVVPESMSKWFFQLWSQDGVSVVLFFSTDVESESNSISKTVCFHVCIKNIRGCFKINSDFSLSFDSEQVWRSGLESLQPTPMSWML